VFIVGSKLYNYHIDNVQFPSSLFNRDLLARETSYVSSISLHGNWSSVDPSRTDIPSLRMYYSRWINAMSFNFSTWKCIRFYGR